MSLKPTHSACTGMQKADFASIPVRLVSKGFTLIEVLIALTLLSIMIVLLFTSLKICADSWEKGENKINNVNQIAVVYNFFQHHLATAKPLFTSATDGEKHLSFQGQTQSLQFVSSFPASAGKLGLQLFSITLQDEANEQTINVSLIPFVTSSEDDEASDKEEVTLINHVSSFKVAYFGIQGVTGEGAWVDEWINKETLPTLVKINIALANDMFWPEMIFDLKVTGTGESVAPVRNILNRTEPLNLPEVIE